MTKIMSNKNNFEWFTPDKVFSYNAYLNFVVGLRGVGKTYGAKKWCIKRFLKTGEKFIYLKRFKEDFKGDEIAQFFDDIAKDKDLSIHEFKVRGKKLYVDNQECGQVMMLSVQQGKKSIPYPDTNTIIFDEFIIEKGYQHYLPNEPLKLLGFMDTIFRNRENVRCLCLANSVSWVNPYFTFYKFMPMQSGYQLIQEGTVLLNVYENKEFADARSDSKFGKLIKGTAYETMAIGNEFADLNNDFIKKRSSNCNLIINIYWRQKYYGVWYDVSEYCYIISNKMNADANTLCYTTKDYKPNMMLITDKNLHINKELKRAFVNGFLYYEDVYIRNEIYDLFTAMGVR